MSEASAAGPDGVTVRIVKGAFAQVAALTPAASNATAMANELEAQGFRVLAVASGPPDAMKLAGMIALSDPPRADSAGLISELHTLRVRAVMITGDAAATAAIVAHAVGLDGKVCPPGPIPGDVRPNQYSVFAGVLPEGKFDLVKAFQKVGHIVGMCGDGVNDAPALRQAQMGIAVSTATDVAKSAAGIVLIKPGLSGIVAAVKEGRTTFQRIQTYTINSVTKKILQVLFLAAGLIMTGQAILTPMLIVILMVTGDFLAMSLTTDNVRPSPLPNSWQIGRLTVAGVIIGVCDLLFCIGVFAFAKFHLLLGLNALRTLAVILIVFAGEAALYSFRERRRIWSSRPSRWVIASSVGDIVFVSILATRGIAMTALPLSIVFGTFCAAIAFAFAVDLVKVPVFRRLAIS